VLKEQWEEELISISLKTIYERRSSVAMLELLHLTESMTAIYLTQPGSLLDAKRGVFELWHDDRRQRRIPAKLTSQILVFEDSQLSKTAIALAISFRLPVLFLDRHHRHLGRLHLNPNSGSQHRSRPGTPDPDDRRDLAERLVSAILNSRQSLLNTLDGAICPTVELTRGTIARILDELPTASGDRLREHLTGVDRLYYPALRQWLRLSAGTVLAPIDPWFYLAHSLLEQVTYGFVLDAGVNPYESILHCDTGDNLPLVRDLMLEWTVTLVDLLVLRFCMDEFLFSGNGNGSHSPLSRLRDRFVQQWETQLASEAIAGTSYRQCLFAQVRRYREALWGDRLYSPVLLRSESFVSGQPLRALRSRRSPCTHLT